MKKNDLIIIFFLLFIIFFIINNIEIVNTSINTSFIIFKDKVFPNLFPFLIVSEFLINYGFVNICNKLFSNLMNKIFYISGNASFIFFMSLLTGFPSSSKYTKDLYLKGFLTIEEANYVIMFTHFSNPLFVIGITSPILGLKTSYLILFSHYLGNLIIALIFRNKKIKISNKKNNSSKIKFSICFSQSIKKSIDTLLLIFGSITIFIIISSIINKLFLLNPLFNSIISGLLEMSQGINNILSLNINKKLIASIITTFISFGGLCVHFQIISIISDTEIKYKKFLLARILHALFSFILINIFI